MSLARKIKRSVRVNFYAGPRFGPSIARKDKRRGLVARILQCEPYLVIYTSSLDYAPIGIGNHIGHALAAKPVIFLLFLPWTMERTKRTHRIATAIQVYENRRPNHRVLVLCNTAAEQVIFEAEGVSALFCNQNALCVDEDCFRPLGQKRHYEAIYNGAMVPWKRHDLAAMVGLCAHIFYQKSDFEPQKTMQLLDDLKKQMPSHSFINPVDGDVIEAIEPDQVNGVINQSRVGLCLSAAEGAMLASMEYLLAGIPVVSTEALGGRDVFADPAYWLTVDDRAEAVADGVAAMAKLNLDPHQVRRAVLEKVYAHRDRLRRALIDMTDGAVCLPDDLGDPTYHQPMKWWHGDALADAILAALKQSA